MKWVAQAVRAAQDRPLGDFADGQVGVFKQVLGVLEALIEQPAMWGVVPVAAVNRRATVRGDISAGVASCATVIG